VVNFFIFGSYLVDLLGVEFIVKEGDGFVILEIPVLADV
jgi:hypothetical protein